MADKKQETPAVKQPEAAALLEGQSDPAADPVDQSQSSAKSFHWAWVFLATLILAISLAWLLVPEAVRQPYTEKMSHWFSAPSQQTAIRPPVSSPATKPRQTPRAEAAAPDNPQAVSSSEAALLLNAIKALQEDLRQAQQNHQASTHASHLRQVMELQTRLRWIAQPESQLPQLRIYWEDIALLPMLNDRERTQAKDMLRLARQQATQVRAWRNRLLQLANNLPVPEAEEISIKPDNKWLAWLADQFRLSTSPSHERRQREILHNQLLAAEQHLLNGQWLPAADWQFLLERLKQQLDDDAELDLPQDFDDVKNDIRDMRQTAQNWLGKLADDAAEELN